MATLKEKEREQDRERAPSKIKHQAAGQSLQQKDFFPVSKIKQHEKQMKMLLIFIMLWFYFNARKKKPMLPIAVHGHLHVTAL